MNKITILDAYTVDTDEEFLNNLKQFGTIGAYYYDKVDDVATAIGDSNIVLSDSTRINEETILRCPNLEYVGLMATGTDSIDMSAAKHAGITVTNVPSYGTDAVAQHTMALLLQITNHMEEHINHVKTQAWVNGGKHPYWDFSHVELTGKTLGIVGYGDIGKKVTEMALGFGMNIIVSTSYPNNQEDSAAIKFVSFDELLTESDVISLHKPLTKDNMNLIDRVALLKMKEGAILINTARGGLVDEAALYECLKSKHLYAAGLDVMKNEPTEKSNPLLECDNCIITPHIAFAGDVALKKLRDIVISNLKEYLN